MRMPFGLKNSTQAFQQLMDSILRDVPHAFVYLGNILVTSANLQEHLEELRFLFEMLEKSGMVVNHAKCVFGAVEFLGHTVSAAGIVPLPSKVEAIRRFSRPVDITSLQRYLGMQNFYKKFIPHTAELLQPLYAAFKGKPPPKVVE